MNFIEYVLSCGEGGRSGERDGPNDGRVRERDPGVGVGNGRRIRIGRGVDAGGCAVVTAVGLAQTVYAVGLGPGTRDMLRATFGV